SPPYPPRRSSDLRRERSAAEAADPPPVQPLDDHRPAGCGHLPARARDHAARRRPRRGRGQARHLELAAAGPARGDLHGVEELLRRGFPDVHPGADLRGRAAALVRLLPVSRPALVRPAPGPSAPPPARHAARRWARTSPTGMLTTVTTSAARKSHSAQAGPCAPRP